MTLRRVGELLDKVDAWNVQLRQTYADPYDPQASEAASALADYVVVRAYAEFELHINLLLALRCEHSQDRPLGCFVRNRERLETSPEALFEKRKSGRIAYGDLTATLAGFGANCKSNLDAHLKGLGLDPRVVEADWGKVTRARHSIAHYRGYSGLTLSEVRKAVASCCSLVEAYGQALGVPQAIMADLD